MDTVTETDFGISTSFKVSVQVSASMEHFHEGLIVVDSTILKLLNQYTMYSDA